MLGEKCLVTATTGIAAFSINGQTLHSAAQLPIRDHRELQSESLQHLQLKLEGRAYLIVDEKVKLTLLKRKGFKSLAKIFQRTKCSKVNEDAFGQTTQLSTKDNPIWNSIKPLWSSIKSLQRTIQPICTNQPLRRAKQPLWRANQPLRIAKQPLLRAKQPLRKANQPLWRAYEHLWRKQNKPLLSKDEPQIFMKPDVTRQQNNNITHSDHCVYDCRSSVTVRGFITKQPNVKRYRDREPSRIPFKRIILGMRKRKNRPSIKSLLKRSAPRSSIVNKIATNYKKCCFKFMHMQHVFIMSFVQFKPSVNFVKVNMTIATTEHYLPNVLNSPIANYNFAINQQFDVSGKKLLMSGDIELNPGPIQTTAMKLDYHHKYC